MLLWVQNNNKKEVSFVFTLGWLTLIFISWYFMLKSNGTTIKEFLGKSMDIAKGLRVSHFIMAIPIIAAIVIVGSFLYSLHPILQFGWLWSMLTGGEQVVAAGFPWVSLLIGIMIGVFSLFIPMLAYNEEVAFRESYIDKGWGKGLVGSLIFGLAHMVMGIPLAFALALSIGGVAFLYIAKKKGIMESTYVHAAYNFTVITLVLILVWSDVFTYLLSM